MIKLCAFADEAGSSLKEQINALNKNDVNLVELRSINGVNVSEFSLLQAKEYARELGDNGVSVWAIGSPLGKVDINVDFNKYLNTVKHVYELANIFGSKNVRAFSFFNAYNQENRVFDYLQIMVEIAKSEGLCLCHENEKDIYGDTLERILKLKLNVKGLYHVYDPANFLQCKQSAQETLNALQKDTYYYHIKDVISSTGELVPAGYGDGKISTLIDNITGDKVFSIEPHLALFSGYSAIDKSQMKNKFVYENQIDAFNSAVTAIKNLLEQRGYFEKGGAFIK